MAIEDELTFIHLNHPEGMEKYRQMYGWKVCGFCEGSYNPKKHFDGVMYKEDENGESKPICHRCLYPYKYSY